MDIAERERMHNDYRALRPKVEACPLDQPIDQETVQRAVRLSREADLEFDRRLARGEAVPDLLHEIRDFMLANELPTDLKGRTGHYRPAIASQVARDMGEKMDAAIRCRSGIARPGITRQGIVQLMREHYEDPAGFHEALANELEIRDEEYEPPKLWRYKLSEDVIDAACRVANVARTQRTHRLAAGIWADIALIADTISEGEGEAVDD